MTLPALTDEVVLLALSVLVPGAMLAGPKAVKWYRKKCADRKAIEAKRDATLQEVADTLKELSGDVKCLYQVSAPQLDALEITLLALHGEQLNGNVTEAISKIRAAKMNLSGLLMDKVGNDLRGAD